MCNEAHSEGPSPDFPSAPSPSPPTGKLDFLKIKAFVRQKTIKKMKRQATHWEKLSESNTSDSGLCLQHVKDSCNSDRQTTEFKNEQKKF